MYLYIYIFIIIPLAYATPVNVACLPVCLSLTSFQFLYACVYMYV